MKPPADLDAHRARRRRPTREELQRRAADIERAEAARLASVADNDDDNQAHGVDPFNGGPLW